MHNFILFSFFTLQYCISFAVHQHESATGIHVFPILNPLLPPSPYHPSGSSQCTSPKHPVSCIKPGLAVHFIYDIIHVPMPNNILNLGRTVFNRERDEILYFHDACSRIIYLKHKTNMC